MDIGLSFASLLSILELIFSKTLSLSLSLSFTVATGSTIICHCTDKSSSVPCNNKDQTCVLSQGGGKCYFDVTGSGNENVFGCYENDILTKCVNKGISRQCCDNFDKCNIEFLTPTISRSIALSTTVPSNISSIDVTSTNDSTTSVIIISTADSTAIVTYASSIPMHTTAPINNSTTVQPECSCADSVESVPKYGQSMLYIKCQIAIIFS